jgi:signal-transduction protein with cAMP-binding, CBS, and nucleotidyltransferase domain
MIEQLDRFVRKDRDLITARPDETARQAAQRLAEMDVGCLLVLAQEGELVGVVTEKDLVHKVLAQGRNPEEVTVGEIMSTDVVTCDMSVPVYRAGEMMARRGARHLPILDKGKVVGMVSSRDIIAHEIALVQKQAQKRYEALRQEKQQVP